MEESIKQEWFELLRCQSVSSDPTHLRDSVQCAMLLKTFLKKLGFEAELVMNDIKNGGGSAPVVLASRICAEDAPTILIYGHYDVQSPDPVGEWQTPPFEPVEKDGRVYCRGAQDDKGQLFALLCGVRDFIKENADRPINIKVLIEGEEEIGSAALLKLLPSIGKKIAADVLLVCDTSAGKDLQPAIVAGLRGVSHFTIRLSGPGRDLHSGEYGGVAPNPAQAIAELVASLHNPNGSIAVEGFMDGIEPPLDEELRLAAESTPSKEAFEEDIGCEAAGGEYAKPIVERLSFMPTIEVNGIHSGYGGVGSKTVIPSSALAKISMRLAPGQSPRHAFETVRTHLENHLPRGMKLEITEYNPGAGGFRLPVSAPVFKLAAMVLEEMDERGALFQWDGASIPAVSAIREASGAAPLLVGWGQPGDNIHSPNESYSFRQFGLARSWAREFLSSFSM